MMVEDRFLNVAELAERYGCCRDTIYKRIRRGLFPRGVHIGAHRRWRLSEVVIWETQQAERETSQEGSYVSR